MVHEGVHRGFPRATQCAWACAGSERGAWRERRQQLRDSMAHVGVLFFGLAATSPSDWQTTTGKLMYRTPKTTLIGEALVRFSKTGDFELTVSKGPGITLLSLRQDAAFAEIKGAFARQGWSGPVAHAPPQLRGWLGLRDQFIRAPNQKTVRYAVGNETFLFRF